ncbi:hypothetical protein [Massilia mucilaginosa]|uniref:hypothetical protein n=1 Tax=Massilia mucilaginosa TaxID=2609282 RepID=UPI0014207B83|nr:hypothetical protein [Massilia mucilaginosa]
MMSLLADCPWTIGQQLMSTLDAIRACGGHVPQAGSAVNGDKCVPDAYVFGINT